MNQNGSGVYHYWYTIYANKEYTYTFDQNVTGARIYVFSPVIHYIQLG